jgi:hypothetical protein
VGAAAQTPEDGDWLPDLPGAAEASALCATTEEVVAVQDRWGAAAVEEVAAMYGALPVVYLSPVAQTPAAYDEVGVSDDAGAAASLSAPAAVLTADVWSKSDVHKHKQIARVLSLLLGL